MTFFQLYMQQPTTFFYKLNVVLQDGRWINLQRFTVKKTKAVLPDLLAGNIMLGASFREWQLLVGNLG